MRFMSESKLYKFLKEKTVAEDLIIQCYNTPHTITGYDQNTNIAGYKSIFQLRVTATEDEVMDVIHKFGK
jgi:hypothetical protein